MFSCLACVIMLKEIDDVARSLPHWWKGGEAKGGWECIITFAGDLFLLLVISINRNTKKKKLRRTSFLEDGRDGLPFHPRHSLSVPLWCCCCHVVMGWLGWVVGDDGWVNVAHSELRQAKNRRFFFQPPGLTLPPLPSGHGTTVRSPLVWRSATASMYWI